MEALESDASAFLPPVNPVFADGYFAVVQFVGFYEEHIVGNGFETTALYVGFGLHEPLEERFVYIFMCRAADGLGRRSALTTVE